MAKNFLLHAILFFVTCSGYCQTSTNNAISIKTIVIEKTIKSGDSAAWSLYGDAATKIKSGNVLVGDSVTVIGWAPWAYHVTTNKTIGYISWKALKVTEELKALSEIIKEQSSQEYEKMMKVKRSYEKPNAFLSVNSDKMSISAGECVVVSMAFNVHRENAAPLRFYDLGAQLSEIQSTTLVPDDCFIINSRIEDITGEEKLINDIHYTTYTIYKASYCPMKVGSINFPPIDLDFLYVRSSTDEPDSIITFTSKPLSVKVNALPSGATPDIFEGMPLAGKKIILKDSVFSKNIHAGEPVHYQVKVSGNGLTYPIEAPVIKLPGARAQLMDITDSDLITGDVLYCSKIFHYQLIFDKPGVFDLAGKISINYYNIEKKKVESIKSTSIATVLDGSVNNPVKMSSNFGTKNNFIAIDVSQSMAVEDYHPNRLEAVKAGLKQFVVNDDNCDVGLILFGGDARHYSLPSESMCYTTELIDSIDFETNKKGTAIGAAIWLSKISFAKSPRNL